MLDQGFWDLLQIVKLFLMRPVLLLEVRVETRRRALAVAPCGRYSDSEPVTLEEGKPLVRNARYPREERYGLMAALRKVMGLFVLAVLLALAVAPVFGQSNPWGGPPANQTPWYNGGLPPGNKNDTR